MLKNVVLLAYGKQIPRRNRLKFSLRRIKLMTNRYEENVFEKTDATNDVYLTLPSIQAGEYAEELSVYTDKDGNRAVITPGWMVSGIKSENTIWGKDVSLVIYRIPKNENKGIDWNNSEKVDKLQRTYDQMVWCPVNLLEPDGTLDGIKFNIDIICNRKLIKLNTQTVNVAGFQIQYGMACFDSCHPVVKCRLYYIFRRQA